MRKPAAVLIATLALAAAGAHTPQRAEADATCYSHGFPTPVPQGLPGFTFPECKDGHVQTDTTITGVPTPIPFATTTGGVLLVQPTNVPTLGVNVLNTPTVNAGTGFPTPLAVQPITFPLTFQTAFPTPIPFPATQSVTQGTSPWIVNTPVPFPTAIGGVLKVDGSAVTQPVSGTFFQATQPVSGSVSVSNFPATQPVSGTITANQGTSPWVVTTPAPFSGVISGTVTSNQGTSPWVNNITQFGGSAFALGTAAIGSSLSVTPATGATFPVSGTFFQATQPISGSVSVSNFPATQSVSGTVTANAGSGTFTVGQATGSNLHAVLDAGVAVIGHVINDASAAVIGHVITDAGSVVNATLQASAAVIGHVIVDSGTIALSAGAATIGSIANTTFAVTQATGTNLHAVLDANAAVVIGTTRTDLTTPGLTNLVNAKVCDKGSPAQCASVSAGGLVSTGPFLAGAGVPTQAVACDKSVAVNINSATTTQIVALSGATAIYVCGFTLDKSSGAATTFQFVYGTGASCVTGPVVLTGAMDGAAGSFISGSGLGTIFRTAASQALCITTVGAIGLQGFVSYGQF